MSDSYCEITEPDYTEDELMLLASLRRDLVDGHGPCGGEGVIYSGGDVRDCTCRSAYNACRRLVAARVPGRLMLASITGVDGVHALEETTVLLMMPSGSGRTAALVGLCRRSLEAGVASCYVRAAELLTPDQNLSDRLRASSLVLVDDLDRTDRRATVIDVLRVIRDAGTRIIAVSSEHDAFFERTGEVKIIRVTAADAHSEEFREGLIGPER
jgi:hypothetical protein